MKSIIRHILKIKKNPTIFETNEEEEKKKQQMI